jgi:6-pyruvoyltetrahydropterin/6-carboxytetrahydropterin synthase
MFETGTSIAVRAAHVMPGVEGPEGELHDHDYRIEVVVGRPQLDARGMVIDLDVLDAALRDVARVVDGADLEVIRPPEAEAVTVEIFARWAYGQLVPAAREAGAEELTVRVWESADAFGGYRAGLGVGPSSSSA